MLSISRQLGQQVGLEVDHAAAGDVVEQHRQVGGRRRPPRSAPSARAGWACCSRASRPARRPRRARPPARVRCTECAVSFEPVPATTVALSPTSSTTISSRRSFSSSSSVGDSPVVPATTSAVGAVVDEVAREPPGGVLVHRAVGVERRRPSRSGSRRAAAWRSGRAHRPRRLCASEVMPGWRHRSRLARTATAHGGRARWRSC